MNINLNISLNQPKFRTNLGHYRAWSTKVIIKTLDHLHFFKHLHTTEISINLCNDAEIQELNSSFRGKNKPTNVLSFPAFEIKDRNWKAALKNCKSPYLGDIAVAYETLVQEAIQQNKTFKDHYTHLLIHSVLHLLGYDHEISTDAEIMEALEIEILNQLGIKNPYILGNL